MSPVLQAFISENIKRRVIKEIYRDLRCDSSSFQHKKIFDKIQKFSIVNNDNREYIENYALNVMENRKRIVPFDVLELDFSAIKNVIISIIS